MLVVFLILAPEVNKAAIEKEKETRICKDELELTKTGRNLSESLADSNFDGMTFRKTGSIYHGANSHLAHEPDKLVCGGDPQATEGSVGLTAAQQ